MEVNKVILRLYISKQSSELEEYSFEEISLKYIIEEIIYFRFCYLPKLI